MLAKVVAAWLLVLTVSPFTAPLQACDLATFLTERAPASPHRAPQATIALAATSLARALPIFRSSGRVRFPALSVSRTTPGVGPLSTAASPQSLKPVTTGSQRLGLTTLRI